MSLREKLKAQGYIQSPTKQSTKPKSLREKLAAERAQQPVIQPTFITPKKTTVQSVSDNSKSLFATAIKNDNTKPKAETFNSKLQQAIQVDKPKPKMTPGNSVQANFNLAPKNAQNAQTIANALPAGLYDAVGGTLETGKIALGGANYLKKVVTGEIPKQTITPKVQRVISPATQTITPKQDFTGQQDSQIIYQLGRPNLKGASGVAADLLYTTGQQLPAAAAQTFSPGLGYAVLGSGVFGNSYKQAKMNGAKDDEALASAIANTVSEVGTEAMSGGIGGLGKSAIDNVVDGLTKRIVKNKTALTLVNKFADMTGEGFEEALSTQLTPYLQNELNTGAKKADAASLQETLYSGFLGFLSAGVLGAGQVATEIASQPKTDKPLSSITPKIAPTTAQSQPTTLITPKAQNAGAQPDITAKRIDFAKLDNERGFSANTRTNFNVDENLRSFVADDVDTYDKLSNKETLSKAADIYSNGYQSAKSELDKAIGSRKLSPELVPLTVKLANEATKAGNVQEARQIISDVGAMLTEYGQVIQAANILRRTDPMATADVVQKIVDKLNIAGEKKFGKRWSAVSGLTDAEMTELSQIKEGDTESIQNFLGKVGVRISQQIPSTFMEKLTETRKIAMLANPKTMIKNFAANVPIAGERKISNKISAGIQNAFIKDPALRTQAFKVDENSKKLAKQLFENNLENLKGGDKWDLKQIIGQNRRIFKSQPLEQIRSLVYSALEKGDAPFLKSAFVDRAASYIAAQGYESIDQIPQKVVDTATEEALKATFKDASTAFEVLQKVKRVPVLGAALDLAMPFTKTPVNLVRRGYDYSPVNAIKSGVDLYRALHGSKSSADLTQTIDRLAQGLTGTGVTLFGLLLAHMGFIVGSLDKDKDIAAMQKQQGIQKYSIKVPDGSISYAWASPFGTQLAIGAEMLNSIKKGGDPVTVVMNMVSAFGDVTLSSSVYQNILDMFSGYGSPTDNIIKGTIGDLPQQLIWAGLGQIARTVDPTVRMIYGNTELQNQINSATSKIPGASYALPAAVDIWGNEKKRIQNPVGRAANELFSPAYYTANNQSPLNDEILKVYKESGSKDIFPKVAPKYFMHQNNKVELTLAEQSQFQKDMGQYAAKSLEKMFNAAEYKKLNSTGKAKFIKAAIEKSYDVAKYKYLTTHIISKK